ncbi:helix-turn-helix domain-containing protein [Sciscionella marina]|uniref:helix-turn-helix domain-containing protein n=1 Tax=Sciscionella marina TaxID=508770 RepID=UPI0003A1E737|nr:helix-turn-helix domain-containing protein [Sciscionella marina]
MTEEMYSVEQVAERLGLHVRTVRAYIRSGKLAAVRIGKQYRIARADLEALTGRTGARPDSSIEVSSIVQIEGVDTGAADRIGTLVLTAVNTGRGQGDPLQVQTVHDPERERLKIVLFGAPAASAEVLRLIDEVLPGILRD